MFGSAAKSPDQQQQTETDDDEKEDSQGDGLFIDKDVDDETVLFPEEF
jgi:hypothetical protein